MKINKDNYEAFFLDFAEGNLSSSEIDELMAFIEQFPELRSELESFENISITPEHNIFFKAKESLKRTESDPVQVIHKENIDNYLIAETEGILSEEERILLEEFLISNPSFRKDQQLFAHTRLTPDNSIIFEAKESVKHKAIPVSGITETNYEEFMVAEIEGQLNHETRHNLDKFLELNPHLEKARRIYSHTVLKPDESIVFANKNTIRHRVIPIRKITLYTLAAAASITLLFTVPNLWNTVNNPEAVKQLSSIEPIKSKQNSSAVSTIPGNLPKTTAIDNTTKSYQSGKTKTINQADATRESRNMEPVPVLNLLANHTIVSRDYVEPEFKFVRTSQMHSNEFIELYYNLKLSEQIQYAQINEVDRNPEKTLVNSFTSKIGELFASNRKPEQSSNSGISVWTFAELGVKTYNNITHDNVKLDLQRDEEGKVVNYNLYGDKLDFQRDIKK